MTLAACETIGELIEVCLLDVELQPDGADKPVTIWNIDEYVEGVLDATLGAGIHSQVLALRAGFEDVLPISVLACFDADELDRLLCGEQNPWTVSTTSF
eukprot:COSAG05_NODE_10382_length_568_cov_1.236674_1_plen_98_part_10